MPATAHGRGAASVALTPRVVAQRQQLQAAFGTAIERSRAQSGATYAEVAQRAKLGTGNLDSVRKYVSWYFSGGGPKMEPGAALREIYAQIGIDNGSPETRRTRATLLKDGVIDAQDVADLERSVGAYLSEGPRSVPPERKALSAETWRHIWRGDFNKAKKKPTGYHWKGKGDASWLVGTGTVGENRSGFYEEEVQIRDDKVDDVKQETGVDKSKIRGAVKDDRSTFFPDHWNEADVRDAIELRDSGGRITTKDADGITLVKSGATVFPTID